MMTVAISSAYAKSSIVRGEPAPAHPSRIEVPEPRVAHPAARPVSVLAPLFEAGLDLHAPPIALPLQLRIPSLNLAAPIVGVGITSQGAMDAPMGPPSDAVWQQAFWYRGSGIPGNPGTATIAGHVRGGRGASAFAHLEDLRPGDLIIVRDARTGLDARFIVSATKVYSLERGTDPAVLERIYGAGPVSGGGPRATSDGLSHLTLITCAGDYVGSSYDQRLAVYAERAG